MYCRNCHTKLHKPAWSWYNNGAIACAHCSWVWPPISHEEVTRREERAQHIRAKAGPRASMLGAFSAALEEARHELDFTIREAFK